MKHYVWPVAVGFLLLGHLSLVQAEEIKIGFVNLAKVFDGYNRTKTSDATLEKKGKQKEAELEARMNELRKLREGLELLHDDARELKAREIEERAEELQRFRTTTARDLRRDRDKLAKEILKEIQQALEEYAKTNGYALLIDSRSLLYGRSAEEVTDEVLTLLNSRNAPAANR
jgi:outer membrane protein